MLRSDWIYRNDMESREHKYNYFLTLTFNDANLPPDEESTFDIFYKFRKQLNSVIGTFKYFVSLERGDLNGRIHLHALFYLDRPLSKDLIRHYWHYGFIKRSSVTLKRIRYCVSYMFDPTIFDKVRLYRVSNCLGGNPVLPYRIRIKRGVPTAVPLPRYYCRKNPAAKEFAKKYYDGLYHDNNPDSVYDRCSERFLRLRSRYGKKRLSMSYEDFLIETLRKRVRKYPTFIDSRDLIAFPGPSHYRGLSRTYSDLLRRVDARLAANGDRRSGNLKGYLTIDCPMSLRDVKRKNQNRIKGPPKYQYWKDFYKKYLQLKLF